MAGATERDSEERRQLRKAGEEALSPLAAEVAQGLREGIQYLRGKGPARETTAAHSGKDSLRHGE